MKVALVGERYGREEASLGQAWVGGAGRALRSLLRRAGYRDDWQYLMTNVVNQYGEIEYTREGRGAQTPVYAGKYLAPEYDTELMRMWDQVNDFEPDLVVALGGLAAWAFLGGPVSVQKLAGTMHKAPRCAKHSYPLLITWNPAAILHREDNLRPYIQAHLLMARLLVEGRIKGEGSYQVNAVVPGGARFGYPADSVAVDIETCRGAMDMCGVGTPEYVDVYTFASWPECEPLYGQRDFLTLYRVLADALGATVYLPGWDAYTRRLGYGKVAPPTHSPIPRSLCFHNGGGFDVQYLLEAVGLDVRHNYTDDTRVMGRCVDPEGKQGLKDLAPRYLGWQKWGWSHTEGEDK